MGSGAGSGLESQDQAGGLLSADAMVAGGIKSLGRHGDAPRNGGMGPDMDMAESSHQTRRQAEPQGRTAELKPQELPC